MILSSSTPIKSCLKSVPTHEWKRSRHSQSVSVFRRGVIALSSQMLFLCFLGFCFPSGHDIFSVPIGHLFPIFGAELKRYLSCNSCVPTQRCISFPLGGDNTEVNAEQADAATTQQRYGQHSHSNTTTTLTCLCKTRQP